MSGPITHDDEIEIMRAALKANGVEAIIVRADGNPIVVGIGTPEGATLLRSLLNHLIGDELGTIN